MLLACIHFEDVVDKDNNNYRWEPNTMPFPLINAQKQKKSSSYVITQNSYFYKKPSLLVFSARALLSRETGFL